MTEGKANDAPIHLEILLDDSYSMNRYKNDTLKGFNEFIEMQKKEEGSNYTTCTLNLFSTTLKPECEMMRLNEIPPLEIYEPQGTGTALYVSIKEVADKLSKQLEGREGCTPKVIVVIITDGKDNMSNEANLIVTSEDIKNIVQNENPEWLWMYMGAVHNPKEEAEKMGITHWQGFKQDEFMEDPENPEMLYTGTQDGMRNLSRNVSVFSQSYRSSPLEKSDIDDDLMK